jgi:polyhydroxybutyrate depolymerase
MRRALATSAAVALAMAVCTSTVLAQRKQIVTWKVDRDMRRAILYTPSAKSPNGKAPLVFSFHGRGDNIESFEYTDMHIAWPEAIVVYFQGLPGGRASLPGWQNEKGIDNDRDLKLVDAALAALREKYVIDEDRIYATGFSNGANFTYLLWAERANVFAAFAPVAAMLRPSVRPTKPRPLFHVGGIRDAQIPFAQQKEATEIARRVNGEAAPVLTWFHTGGHEYPRTTSTQIAKFFRDHPRQP